MQTNHRSWGDFYIDVLLVEYQGAYLARWAVFIALPMACAVAWLGRQGLVIFFARKKNNVDKEALLKQLDKHFEESMNGGLIVYPEGTRNQNPYSNPIKFGLVRSHSTRYLVDMPMQLYSPIPTIDRLSTRIHARYLAK